MFNRCQFFFFFFSGVESQRLDNARHIIEETTLSRNIMVSVGFVYEEKEMGIIKALIISISFHECGPQIILVC